jgi:hypothetical protein
MEASTLVFPREVEVRVSTLGVNTCDTIVTMLRRVEQVRRSPLGDQSIGRLSVNVALGMAHRNGSAGSGVTGHPHGCAGRYLDWVQAPHCNSAQRPHAHNHCDSTSEANSG